MNALLFVVTVLIWGTTWMAIALQVGPVPALVSIFYRFTTAAVVFLTVLALTGRLAPPRRADRPWIAVQALCLFCLNFLCFYRAAAYVPSGLIAVIFSLATVFNAVNARIFWGDPVRPRTLLAAALGIAGLALLFLPAIGSDVSGEILKGGGLAVLGTLLFSFGNMASRRNSAAGVPPVVANAWGMGVGAAVLFGLILATDTPLVAPPDTVYLAAMLYLAVFGSVVGFTTYLMLVARLGSSRAAYTTVLFPVVALGLSTLFEGYVWHTSGVFGLALALLGNLVMFAPDRRRPRAKGKAADDMAALDLSQAIPPQPDASSR